MGERVKGWKVEGKWKKRRLSYVQALKRGGSLRIEDRRQGMEDKVDRDLRGR